MQGQKALSGIRILDFSHMIAGPFATLLFAYFGAEVIKVESKYRFDGFRKREGRELDASRPFCDFNRNKKAVTINLKKAEGIALVKELVKISDVVVENFSAEVMDKLGLGYEALRAVKEDIIMVSLQGLGKTGPKKSYVTWGPNIMSIGGMNYLWNHPDMEEPVGSQTAYADYVAASHGALAIMASLFYRKRTGEGQFVDVSQVEGLMYLLGPTFLLSLKNGEDAKPLGNSSPVFAPSGSYRCKGEDRWCVIEVQNEEEWHGLCKAFNRPEWELDPRFCGMLARVRNRSLLDGLIEEETCNMLAEDVMELLQRNGVAAGYVMNGEDLLKDNHLRQRDFIVPVPHPKMELIEYPGIPIRLSRTPGSVDKHGPLLGEDNFPVFHDLLGLDEGEINHLAAMDVIA